MLMTYTRHGDLLLAEHTADERQVSTALKAMDPRLRLVWEKDARTGGPVWNVVCVWSPDHPAVNILSWRHNGVGDPQPLTMRLVDEVRRLREQDTVAQIDAANAALKAGLKAQARTDGLAIAAEHKPYVDRNRVQITTAQVGRPRFRNRRPPASAGER